MSAGTAILILFGVLFFIVIISIIWAIAIYNGLVGKRELVNEGWSSIDVQLKRRFNLIKNLVSIVKQYASHEAETLDNLTNARSAAYTDEVVFDHPLPKWFVRHDNGILVSADAVGALDHCVGCGRNNPVDHRAWKFALLFDPMRQVRVDLDRQLAHDLAS